MAISKLNIGKIPIMKGEYQEGTTYQRLNQVTMYGSTYQSKIDNNTSAPAQKGDDGVVKHINTDKWVLIAAGIIPSAKNVVLSNTISEMKAKNVQQAIDELASKNKEQDEVIDNKADLSRVTDELAKKFDKENIVQELGESEDKVASQKVVKSLKEEIGHFIFESENEGYLHVDMKSLFNSPIVAYVEEKIEDGIIDIEIYDSNQTFRETKTLNSSTNIVVYEPSFPYYFRVNYRVQNIKVHVLVNEAAYRYINSQNIDSISADLKLNNIYTLLPLMNFKLSSLVYANSRINPNIGNQDVQFDDVYLEAGNKYYIYVCNYHNVKYNTFLFKCNDNVVKYGEIYDSYTINDVSYLLLELSATESGKYSLLVNYNYHDVLKSYIYVSTEKLPVSDANNEDIQLRQATFNGVDYVYSEHEVCFPLARECGRYSIDIDQNIYKCVFIEYNESNYHVTESTLVDVKDGFKYIVVISKKDGTDFSIKEGEKAISVRQLYVEIPLILENGVFNGAAEDVDSALFIRTQNIPLNSNFRYYVLFPSTKKAVINVQGKDEIRVNYNLQSPTSIVPDNHKFIRLCFFNADVSPLQLDTLSTNDKNQIKVIAIKESISKDYDITLAKDDSLPIYQRKADVIVKDSEAELFLRAIFGSMYSIKAMLYPGNYTMYTVVEAESKQIGCLLTRNGVNNYLKHNVTIDVKGYSDCCQEDNMAQIIVSESLHESISKETAVILCPHNEENLLSSAQSGTIVSLKNIKVIGYGYDKPIVYIDLTDSQASMIEKCEVYGKDWTYIVAFTEVPNAKCVGIRVGEGSNNGIQNYIKNTMVIYCHTGISVNGEHFILEDDLCHHCYNGFAFGDRAVRGAFEHPNIMIGCSIEGCYRLMLLTKQGIMEEGTFVANGLNMICTTLICIGNSTELMWDIPYKKLLNKESELPSSPKANDTYKVGNKNDGYKLYTWNGTSWDVSSTLAVRTKGIKEILKGAYKGRLEGDGFYIDDADSCKNMEVICHLNEETYIKKRKKINESWNGVDLYA